MQCYVCFETNDMIVDIHTYMKYELIFSSPKPPLIKCINCSLYLCSNCWYQIDGCGANCNELGQEKTTVNYLLIYHKYGIIRENNYTPWGGAILWFMQAIYEYQENP